MANPFTKRSTDPNKSVRENMNMLSVQRRVDELVLLMNANIEREENRSEDVSYNVC